MSLRAEEMTASKKPDSVIRPDGRITLSGFYIRK